MKKLRTKLCLLPQISGVEVAPCLLAKISGVEVTPSVTSVESSEQFWRKIRQIWRTCEPWWREMQCNDTSWLKTKDQNEGWYQTRKSQGDRNWEGGSQEGRYRVVEPRFITQTLNDNKVLATQNSAKERSAYNLASPGALTCGHCCGWRCLLWSLCVTKRLYTGCCFRCWCDCWMFILELSQLQLKLQLEFVYFPIIIVFN